MAESSWKRRSPTPSGCTSVTRSLSPAGHSQWLGSRCPAASAPYPGTDCFVAVGCVRGASAADLAKLPPGLLQNPGLVWLTQADVRGLTPIRLELHAPILPHRRSPADRRTSHIISGVVAAPPAP